jgi:hypothetical protein
MKIVQVSAPRHRSCQGSSCYDFGPVSLAMFSRLKFVDAIGIAISVLFQVGLEKI